MRLVNYCPSLKLLSDISAHPKWIALVIRIDFLCCI